MNSSPYFSDGSFELRPGDCRELLARLPEGSVDMVFAEPPCNLSNGGFTCRSGKRTPVDKGSWDESRGVGEDLSFKKEWISACRRVITGILGPIYACGFALQLLGFQVLNDICWFKPNTPPNLSGRYFTASHETLIWARKNANARHTFNYDETKNGDWPEDTLKKPGRQIRSVWSIPSPRGGKKRHGRHPTQKPCALLKRVILSSNHPSDLVVDPFTGSSTTGLVACSLGSRFIGMDTDRDFLDLPVARYRGMVGGGTR